MNDEHDNAIIDAEQLAKLHPLRQPTKASDRALGYFRDLYRDRDWEDKVSELPPRWQELFHAAAKTEDQPYAHQDISKFIDLLRTCDKKQAPNKFVSNYVTAAQLAEGYAGPQPLADGMYRGPKPNEHIYKVYHTVHGANQQVAKRLFKLTDHTFTFKYEGKAPLHFLKPSMRLTMEEAAQFGKLYGVCCICGRTLTNELSIHLGIGPVCGRREFGGTFEFLVKAATGYVRMPESEADIEARIAELKAEQQ